MVPDAVFRLLQALILVGFVANRAYYNRRLPAPEQDTLEQQDRGGLGRLAELLALPGTGAYVAKPAWIPTSGSKGPASRPPRGLALCISILSSAKARPRSSAGMMSIRSV